MGNLEDVCGAMASPLDEPATAHNPFDWARAKRDPVGGLQESIARGSSNLFDVVPQILKVVLERDLWRAYVDKDGQKFTSFENFVTTRLWWGLESSIEDLWYFSRKYPDVQAAILRHAGRDAPSMLSTSVQTPEPTLDDVLRFDPSRSDRSIARQLNVSPTTVGKARLRLGLTAEVRSVQRGGQTIKMRRRGAEAE